MNPADYFSKPSSVAQKKYEALRAFLRSRKSGEDLFFMEKRPGRKEKDPEGDLALLIGNLRKQYLSEPEIKAMLDAAGQSVSLGYIHSVLKKEKFGRLPRRTRSEKASAPKLETMAAPESEALSFKPETFSSEAAIGILCFLPLIRRYGIDRVIQNSSYPETRTINRLSSILGFLALKLSDIARYSEDDAWCMDRGLGLFAGLNVLPKTSWFSSYSSRITRQTNLDFLHELHAIWERHGLLSDAMNLDFSSIPYWGDDSHLENNWSGKRNKAMASILAVLAHDPDSGILDYSDATPRHENQADVILEFLDFYRENRSPDAPLNYLIFDSKFTPYKNLNELDKRGVKFITIRRRGKQIVDQLERVDSSRWKKIRVMGSDGKGRLLNTYEEEARVKDYDTPIRQLAITGHGKIKPALIITNDWEIRREELVRKYCRRWMVEKAISEQIEFFHFNRVSSSMVIKVDFDLTMSVLAHNLYRLLAMNLDGYAQHTSKVLFEKFLRNGGDIEIAIDAIWVKMKKKRNLPALLSEMQPFADLAYPWLAQKKLRFAGSSTS